MAAQQVQGAAAPQAPPQPQAQQQQPQAQQPPMMLQVDGAGDTSSDEDEDEEEEYDEDDDEEKDKDGGEDGQVEEVSRSFTFGLRTRVDRFRITGCEISTSKKTSG